MFELTKRKAFTYAVNHLRWREVGLFSRECHRAFRAVFPMRVFANNVSLLFVFRRFAHLNTLNDSNGPVKLLEHGHPKPSKPAFIATKFATDSSEQTLSQSSCDPYCPTLTSHTATYPYCVNDRENRSSKPEQLGPEGLGEPGDSRLQDCRVFGHWTVRVCVESDFRT